MPNSAFELTRYGRPLLPGCRYLQHFLHPGKSGLPTRSAQFDVRLHIHPSAALMKHFKAEALLMLLIPVVIISIAVLAALVVPNL